MTKIKSKKKTKTKNIEIENESDILKECDPARIVTVSKPKEISLDNGLESYHQCRILCKEILKDFKHIDKSLLLA